MEVARSRLGFALTAVFAVTAIQNNASGKQVFDDERMQIVAPTVTQVSFSDQEQSVLGCTSGCDCTSSGCCDACSSSCDSCGCFAQEFGCCDAGCGSSCDSCCSSSCDTGLLGFGLVKKSEQAFSDFITPMTNPVFFEDPRSLSELRFLFISHRLPAALGGNSVQVYAMQFRARLTERLSLIATKDGFIDTQSPILDSGYADIAAGFKYNLYRNPRKGCILSAGFTYDIPTGSTKSLQGNGNGEWNFFATGGLRFLDNWHLLSVIGLRQPNDETLENGVFYRSVHIDRRVGKRLWGFTEFNWTNYLNSGIAFPAAIEGGDLFNFGSPNITGNDLVTNAVGFRVKPRKNIETGVAYEYPLTARKGIMDDRITADLIIRY